MKVLIACEFSGRVRDAFIAKGHDAISCDLLPTESPGPHLQCNVLSVLDRGWDMMIAFPPCTYLCSSGWCWTKRRPERLPLAEQALDFVRLLMGQDIHKIAIENPVGRISTQIKKPSQIIHPWQFGHDASKTTCLWLQNLPRLIPTEIVPPQIIDGKKRWANQSPCGASNLGPSPDRSKIRSLTYPGIADAMADQWG